MLDIDPDKIVTQIIERGFARCALECGRIILNRLKGQPQLRLHSLAADHINASRQQWLTMSPDEKAVSIALATLSWGPLIAAAILAGLCTFKRRRRGNR